MDFVLVFTTLVIVYALFRYYMKPPEVDRCIKLTGRTAIITGANTGIGKATALDFAKRGARVILACRNLDLAKKAAEEIQYETGVTHNVKVMKLDLASLKSIREFAQQFIKEESRLDILVNNAGLGGVPRTTTEDGFEMHFGVNHLGHFLLTNLLLDLLKASVPSRIVNVSALAHKIGHIDFEDLMQEKKYSRVQGYSRSKLANILFSRELAKRLEGSGVTSYSLHPGAIATDFVRNIPLINLPWIKPVLMAIFRFIILTPEQGALTTIYCSIAPELETVTGKYYSCCAEVSPSSEAQDDDVAKKLWDVSEKLVGLSK